MKYAEEIKTEFTEYDENELIEKFKLLFGTKRLTKRAVEEIKDLFELKVVLQDLGIGALDVKDLNLILSKAYNKGYNDAFAVTNKAIEDVKDQLLKESEEKGEN